MFYNTIHFFLSYLCGFFFNKNFEKYVFFVQIMMLASAMSWNPLLLCIKDCRKRVFFRPTFITFVLDSSTLFFYFATWENYLSYLIFFTQISNKVYLYIIHYLICFIIFFLIIIFMFWLCKSVNQDDKKQRVIKVKRH